MRNQGMQLRLSGGIAVLVSLLFVVGIGCSGGGG